MKPDLGIYYEVFDAIAAASPSLSLLAKPWSDIEVWRSRARAKVFELLAFDPIDVPLKPSIDATRREQSRCGRNLI